MKLLRSSGFVTFKNSETARPGSRAQRRPVGMPRSDGRGRLGPGAWDSDISSRPGGQGAGDSSWRKKIPADATWLLRVRVTVPGPSLTRSARRQRYRRASVPVAHSISLHLASVPTIPPSESVGPPTTLSCSLLLLLLVLLAHPRLAPSRLSPAPCANTPGLATRMHFKLH